MPMPIRTSNPAALASIAAQWDADGANGRTECECDDTHERIDSVCQWCYSHGRRRWNDAEVTS